MTKISYASFSPLSNLIHIDEEEDDGEDDEKEREKRAKSNKKKFFFHRYVIRVPEY